MRSPIEQRGLTRAGMFKVGAAAALAVGAAGPGRALADATAPGLGLGGPRKPGEAPAYLRRDTFAPLVGATFRVALPGMRGLRLRLIEAKVLPGPGESFSLLFRGTARPGLASGIARIDHPALGSFDLFVSPVGRGVKGLDLEALVNRIEL